LCDHFLNAAQTPGMSTRRRSLAEDSAGANAGPKPR
jgi:hypothetical protein